MLLKKCRRKKIGKDLSGIMDKVEKSAFLTKVFPSKYLEVAKELKIINHFQRGSMSEKAVEKVH